MKAYCKWVAVVMLAGAMSVALTGCFGLFGEKLYFHSLSFNTRSDAKVYGKPDVEVLDWVYGDGNSKYSFVKANPRPDGGPEYAAGVTSTMPRGKTLYVKWREIANGAIHEDRVDLDKRMPRNIKKCSIHFVMDGSQLYVLYFPPKYTEAPGIVWRDPVQRKKFQIYPDVK